MIMKKVLVMFTALAGLAAMASAKSYSITLYESSLIGGTELKPGDYMLELKDEKVVIRRGKLVGEAPMKVENASSKYSSTTVRYRNGDGKYHIQEIHIGGTNLKVMVNTDN